MDCCTYAGPFIRARVPEHDYQSFIHSARRSDSPAACSHRGDSVLDRPGHVLHVFSGRFPS